MSSKLAAEGPVVFERNQCFLLLAGFCALARHTMILTLTMKSNLLLAPLQQKVNHVRCILSDS